MVRLRRRIIRSVLFFVEWGRELVVLDLIQACIPHRYLEVASQARSNIECFPGHPQPDKNILHNTFGILNIAHVPEGKKAKRLVVEPEERGERLHIARADLPDEIEVAMRVRGGHTSIAVEVRWHGVGWGGGLLFMYTPGIGTSENTLLPAAGMQSEWDLIPPASAI